MRAKDQNVSADYNYYTSSPYRRNSYRARNSPELTTSGLNYRQNVNGNNFSSSPKSIYDEISLLYNDQRLYENVTPVNRWLNNKNNNKNQNNNNNKNSVFNRRTEEFPPV